VGVEGGREVTGEAFFCEIDDGKEEERRRDDGVGLELEEGAPPAALSRLEEDITCW